MGIIRMCPIGHFPPSFCVRVCKEHGLRGVRFPFNSNLNPNVSIQTVGATNGKAFTLEFVACQVRKPLLY